MIKKSLAALSVFLILFLTNCGKEEIGPVKDIGIYINEIDANGTDWIEFYNSTSATVDLNGFKVYDDPGNKYTIASGTITANGFFILHCDGTGVGGNASFKLSSAGESIYLEDDKGNLIDQVTFPALDNGSSYARFPDGSDDWRKTGIPTKNETNGSSQAATVQNVSRNPIVPSKTPALPVTISAVISDVEGISTVKLYSRKDAAAFTTTAMTLAAGIYSASIPAPGSNGQIDYYIEVVNTRGVTTFYPEDAPSKPLFYIYNTDPLPSLRINEFLAVNSSCCPDNTGGVPEYNDWIEIHNYGGTTVNLDGFYLSDNSANPFRFRIVGTVTLAANSYLIVWADEQGSQGNLHANFQLSALGEEVGLYYKDGREIDNKAFGPQTENVSFGRQNGNPGNWITFTVPTPGAQN